MSTSIGRARGITGRPRRAIGLRTTTSAVTTTITSATTILAAAALTAVLVGAPASAETTGSGSLSLGSGDPVPTDPVAGPTVGLQVLVLDDGSPMVAALADRLAAEGVVVDRIALAEPGRREITRALLADDATATAHYLGVVTPTAEHPALSDTERTALAAVESDYGIREVAAYSWASPAVGLDLPSYSGAVDGLEVTLTPAARAGDWSYLDGTVTLDDVSPEIPESHGYVATPLPGTADSSFTPVLTTTAPGGATGTLLGVFTEGGRERLVSTFASNRHQQHFRVLSHGIVSWLTRGVSTSLYRNTLNVQIDDVFLADDEWSADGDCTIGDGCDPERYPADAPGASSRMDATDVAALTAWQDTAGLRLDMTYNAAGAAPGDGLTDALLASRDRLRWINHTWDHPNLGCAQDHTVTP